MSGKRSLTYGVGINDADYNTQSTVEGICPYYSKWKDILKRCYSGKYHNKQPTYVGCTVCSEWIYFSNFKKWMETQDWEGKQLDKDILIPNNKVYGPDTCVFVSRRLNKLLTYRQNRGNPTYPIGVCAPKNINKFQVQCGHDGKHLYLGIYNTIPEAYHVYTKFKTNLIEIEAEKQVDPRIVNGLRLHIQELWEDYYHYEETGEIR